jgi:hypothetical protein
MMRISRESTPSSGNPTPSVNSAMSTRLFSETIVNAAATFLDDLGLVAFGIFIAGNDPAAVVAAVVVGVGGGMYAEL